MKLLTGTARYLVKLSLIIAFIFGWLALPGVIFKGAAMSAHTPLASQESGLGRDRQAALQKLLWELNAGSSFSEEETRILRKFEEGGAVSDIEADILISRALYDHYVLGKGPTREQQELLDRYLLFAARRQVDVADLKAQLLEQRKAIAAASPVPTTPLAPPPNDTCGAAEVISGSGPFPACSSTVDVTDATTTGDPPLPSCQTNVSRSVWYTFTPATTATYILTLCQGDGTNTTLDDTVMAIYTSAGGCAGPFTELPSSGLTDGCSDDDCVTENLQSFIVTRLNASTQYFIVVWQFGTVPPPPGNSSVHLCIGQRLPPANDTCAAPIALTLNTPINGTTLDATNDYQLSGSACFTGVGQTPLTASGRDSVFSFTAASAGTYSFRVTNYDTTRNLVLYTASSCPAATPGTPVTVATCLAAANRSNSSSAEEVFCQFLATNRQIFIFIDEEPNVTEGGSTFRIEVTRCSRDAEPNNTPATAKSLIFGVEGSINPASDVDFYRLGTPASGSRVFALADGVAANGVAPDSADFDMRVTTTTDTLEYDDFGADALFGSLSPTVAGTPTTGAQTFLRINYFGTTPIASEPYRLYATVQPPGANPIAACTSITTSATDETEPNDTTGQANTASNNYFEGSLAGPAPSTDVDIFSFTASAGDIVFLSLDGDPCRDATPINAALALLNSGGVELISVNDPGSTSSTSPGAGSLTATTPNSPAESLVFRVTATGTYYARVTIGTASTLAGAGDYLLSISKFAQTPTSVDLSNYDAADKVKASRYNNGVLLQWRTGLEVDNLGFNLYRDEGGKRTRINPELIAGSALMVGPGTAMGAGRPYAWFDRGLPQTATASYWIEDIDLDGRSTWHGPFAINDLTADKRLAFADQAQAVLLSRLSLKQEESSGELTSSGKAEQVRLSSTGPAERFDFSAELAVKISVKAEGWYRVTQAELIAAGLDPDVNPRSLQLYVDGEEQPIIVSGEQDGRLDPSDAVEFYGVGLDTAVTDVRTYWLVARGQLGRRISQVQSRGRSVSPASFRYSVERRDRLVYFSALKNGERENFFGPVVSASPVDQALTVRHIDGSARTEATVEVAMQGVSAVAHRLRIQLNGSNIGDLEYMGQSQGITRIVVPHSLLREGANQVRLMAQGGASDVSLVDYVRLTYQRLYRAEGNALRFTAAGAQQVTVDGFTNDRIRVLDITDRDSVEEVTGIIKQGSITITTPGRGARTLLAFTEEQSRRAISVTANQPSSWRKASAGADLLIITRREFIKAVEPLKSHRQSQGFGVAVVDIEDLYDEMSYGQKAPEAIRDFLLFAKTNWNRPPRFVLFVGDSSYDPKNYLGLGEFDLVPAKLVETDYMEAASDEWLADFDADGLAELALGRLPARTSEEASLLVVKIIGYDQSDPSSEILLVGDSNADYNFEAANAQLRSLVAEGVRVEEINRGQMDLSTARERLVEAIGRGQKLVNYTGHGSIDTWRANLFTGADARALTNGERLPVFMMMTCLNGNFQDAVVESLAESLLKSERGGAVAVWASTGMTLPHDQMLMNQEMYRQVFQGSAVTLGEATRRAKEVISDRDVRLTSILFGDPLTQLR